MKFCGSKVQFWPWTLQSGFDKHILAINDYILFQLDDSDTFYHSFHTSLDLNKSKSEIVP